MKPTNPMEQLKAWKANHSQQKAQETAQNRPQATKKAEAKSTPQKKPETQQKAKQAGFMGYTQTSRQFELMKSAIERCKRDYPDCFHHKHQQADESRRIAKNLRQGLKIWTRLAKGEQPTTEMAQQLHHFQQTVNYLAHHFNDVAKYVQEVDKQEVAHTAH